MTLISIDTAHHYTWGQDADGWHLVQTAELSVIQERMPPGTAEVRHSHRHARQFFFILAGQATFELGGQLVLLQARQGIEVAPGIAHQIRNNSQQDLEFLVVSQPPAHGDRVLEAGSLPA
jgi:mannose-6-phosphate isomerase-like protein (cupin superfamily)